MRYLLIAILFVSTSAFAHDRRDGNWWAQLDQVKQYVYVTGMMDGRDRYLAEREGFEPPLGCPKPDFESGAFDHSAISPQGRSVAFQRP